MAGAHPVDLVFGDRCGHTPLAGAEVERLIIRRLRSLETLGDSCCPGLLDDGRACDGKDGGSGGPAAANE